MDSLIHITENAIPSDFCRFAIDTFENSQNWMIEGLSGGGINKSIKDSKDVMIAMAAEEDENWRYIFTYLRENLLHNFVEYLRKNPFCYPNSSFSSDLSLIITASKSFGTLSCGTPHMQMQRYINHQGYFAWHHENEGGSTSNRELFYVYYLNDVDGGETEFKFNSSKVQPKEGTLLIAPAFWTHKHRGNPPNDGQTKYIITGWIESKESDIRREFEEDYFI
jgi:hypothetical protein